MIVNENRGSYGMFSRAGRSSTEKFHILIKKDDILKGSKNNKEKVEQGSDESDLDLFEHDDANFSPKIKFNTKKKKTKPIQEKRINDEKFQEIINKNKRMNITPSFNKYNPKKDYVWKKIVNDYDFQKSVAKNQPLKPKEDIKAKHYLNHEFDVKGKNLIDMNKQTKRKEIIGKKTISIDNDIDIIERKNFTPYDKTFASGFNIKGNTQQNFHLNGTNYKHETPDKKFGVSHSNFGFKNKFDPKRETGFSYKSSSNMKSSRSSFANFSVKSHDDKKKWVKIQAPDFKRMQTREILAKEDQHKEKKRIIPVRFPSQSAIKQRKII